MEIQNNNDKNKFKKYFSWIKSFDIPLSKSCSNINDLRNGDIFLELLKYYFKNIKKNQNNLLLINSANKSKSSIEKMNLVLQILSKLTNNNKIKSRLEEYHSNINEFLKRDDLMFEFLMFFIYIIEQNKNNNNRICRIHGRQNKNNSCVQIDKKNKYLYLDNNDKQEDETINYNTIKNQNNKKKSQPINNKNNFLFYINNENENIINIDNNMNFLFTNNISNLKAKCNNTRHNKEIKSYVTKPKIIKYDSQYFNNHKETIKNIKKNRFTKSETCINNLKNNIKEEKKIDLSEEKETQNREKMFYNYNTYKPTKNKSVTDILFEENKINIEPQNENESELEQQKQNEIDLMHIIKNKRNKSAKNKNKILQNNVYKLLKLTNSKLNNSDKEKLEEKEYEEKEKIIFKNNEDNEGIIQSKINYESFSNLNNENPCEQILINEKETNEVNEVKRNYSSNPKKIRKRKWNELNNDINNLTHKSHSYFNFDINDYNKEYSNYNNNEKIHLSNINIKIKQKKKEIDKEKIILWLYRLNLINGSEVNLINLPQLISDGKLLCEIINFFEKENNKIEGISKEVSIKENALMNINKALEHLNKIEDFPKDNISSYEPIFEIDSLIIWELLDDLYNYYSDRIDIKQMKQDNINTIISINNNNSKINDNKMKTLKNFRKKNMSEISDEFFNINDIKHRHFCNKNNMKNILYKNINNNKNAPNKDKRRFSTNNNKTHYNYSHENFSGINNKENRQNNNNSNIDINQENEKEYIKLINNRDKKKNYFYYVNAFKHYFDKEKVSKEEFKKNKRTLNNSNKIKTEYKDNKNESYYPKNNLNNLYFNYSNSTYFNRINKKTKYPFNPINPNYYKSNKYSTLNNAITINKY